MKLFSQLRGLPVWMGLLGLASLAACKSSSTDVDPTDRPPSISKGSSSSTAKSSSTAPGSMESGADTAMTSSDTHSDSMGTSSSGASSYMVGNKVVSSRAFPTGDRATSAVLLEKTAPAEVMLGEEYAYEIKVTNLTNDKLESVVVTDQLGNTFSVSRANPEPQSSSGGNVSWAIGDLGPGDSRTITVNGSATSVGSVLYCGDVSYASKVCLQTRVVEPRLELVKEGPSQVLKCDPITYTITVSNNGSGSARNVMVSDTLPSGLMTDSGQSTFSFTIPELRAGESKTNSVRVTASGTGTYSNNATASADGGLSASSNTVTTDVVQPSLDLTINCPSRIFQGQEMTFQLGVSNNGDAACENTMLEATIPAGTTFASASNGGTASGGKVVWRLNSLAAGGSADVSMELRADTQGAKTVSATVTCACSDPATADCTTDVQGIPAVLLEVVDVQDPTPMGENETYVIVVTNQGSATDTNIQITCTLEDTMEYVSSSGVTNGSASGNTVTFAPLASLAAKAKAEWRVVVKAVGEGDVRFAVEMDTEQLTRPVNETEATNFYK